VVKKVTVAVIGSMLAVGLVAVMLAELWPPTFSLRRMIAYLVSMMSVAVGVIVANVWTATRGLQDKEAGHE